MNSPLFSQKADTRSVCGKLLQRGSFLVVAKSELRAAEQALIKAGTLVVRPAPGDKNKVQISWGVEK